LIGVFCCGQDIEGIEAIVAPVIAVFSTARRDSLVMENSSPLRIVS